MSMRPLHFPTPVRGLSASARRWPLAAWAGLLWLLGCGAAQALPVRVDPGVVLPVQAGSACLRDASHAARALCMHRLATRQAHVEPAPAAGGAAPRDAEAS